jgi:tetratricopeptide (TPR) repeat protein
MQAVNRAAQLDPLSLEMMRWKSFVMYSIGDCDGVGEVMHRAMEIEPNVGRFRYYLAMCLFETTGELDRALPLAEAEPLGFMHDTALAIFYHALGDQKKAQQHLDTMFVESADSAAYQYGQVYAQWGETEQALAWLETAVKIRDPGILQAADDRLLKSLRGEPRFQQILRNSNQL